MELTYNEKLEVKACAQKLLSGKYFCGYNNDDKETYAFIHIDKYRNALEDALDSVGYDLVDSPHQYKTTFIRKQDGIDTKSSKFNMAESALILRLAHRYLTEIRKAEIENDEVFYKWNDLVEDTGAARSKTEKRDLIDALWKLKYIGICDTNSIKTDMSLADVDGKIAIKVYPSVLCLVNTEVLGIVEERLAACLGEKIDDSVEEDENDEYYE